MWETEEWYKFLLDNGLHEYANAMNTKKAANTGLDI
jgi:hypothetical protein